MAGRRGVDPFQPRVTYEEIKNWPGLPLYVGDVVRFAYEETGVRYETRTVMVFCRWSRPTPPGRATHNRYDHPDKRHPLPKYLNTTPVWHPTEEPAIRKWYREQKPGRGAGGGAGRHKKRSAAPRS